MVNSFPNGPAGAGGSGYAGGGGGGYTGDILGAGGGGGGGSSLIPAGATAVLAGYDEVPRVTLSGVAGAALTPSTQTVSGTVGSAITATSAPIPSDFNGAVTYSISPALPAGLSLNASTGVISGTPTAAQTTTPYTLTATGATSGSATTAINLTLGNGPALTPTFGTPTPTAAGYTVAISNYSGAYNWSTKTTAGMASINGSGLVTVTGLNPGGSATVTVFADRSDYYNGNATVSGTAAVAITLSPSTQSISGTVGTAISPTQTLSASGFSGAVSYAISPALPAGLSLNTSTGVVSGTPTAAQAVSAYTLTGTGATSGSATTDLSVTVAQGAALTPTFGTPTPTANGYTVSISNYDAAYTWAGSATAGGSVSISGSGLVTVSGLAPSASATTTVSVSRTGYDNGSATVTGSASAPTTALSPTTQTISATQNLPLTPTAVLTPTGFSAAPSFTISPSLPAGLSLNTVTGVISGTPTATQAATVHTVTATGGSLTATSALNLTVSALAAPTPSPATQALTGTPGSALTPSAAYTGATAATFSVQPPLPEGLSLNSTTGVISGTPTGFSPAGGALATWYSNDFATSDLKQAAVTADASLTGGQIVLTPSSTNTEGAFSILGDVGSGINAQAYKTEFTMNISGTTGGPYGADGISYSFTDSPDLSRAALSANAEVGVGPRLSVSFDSYGTNVAGYRGIRVLYGPKPNDPSNVPGVDNVLAYNSSMAWWGTGKKVRVEIDAQARLTLTLLDNPSVGTNTVIFNQLQLPAEYLTADRANWQHIFAARTFSAGSMHAIADALIEQSGPGAGQYIVTATNAAPGSGTAAVSLAVGDLPAAPSSLTATIPATGQATIGFTPPTGPGFGYQYSLDGTNWLAANVVNNAFTLSGLSGQSTIRVRAVNSAGPGPSTSILVGTPSAPTALSATAGNGQASISFTAGADGGSPITSYEFSVNGGSSWTPTGSFSSPVKLTGLTNGTAYNVLLRGINALGNGTDSTVISVTPVADPPGIPGDLTVSVSGNNATLNWDAPNNGGDTIIGYTVEIATSPTSYSPAPASCSGVVGATGCTITNLQSGTYFFRVKATNSRGSGGYTYTADGTNIPNLVPNAPTTLVATPASQQVSIAFVAPTQTYNGDPISNYPVLDYEYRLGSGAWTSAGTTTSPVTIAGLTNGTGYTITLRAVNAAGASTASSSVSVTPATAPSAPTITGATASTSPLGQVSIAFNAGATGGSAITSYQYSINGGSWTSGGSGSPIVISSGLTKGVNAVIGLRAVNGVGYGPADTVSVTPLGVPDAPTDVSAVATSGQAKVRWSPPDNTGGAQIIDYTVTSSPSNLTCTTNTTGCNVTGLTNGTAYTFTVRARNTYGSSIASNPSASVSPGAVPGAPQSVTATAGNAQASVSWSAPSTNTPATTSYTVVADQDPSKTCTIAAPTLTCNVTGLTNGTAYSFSVTATNGLGTGAAGSTPGTVTPKTVPGAPLGVSAVAGNAAVTVSWSAPDSNGGSVITGYTVTGSPSGGCTAVGSSSCTVTGLTNGTAYSFTVTATNAAGTSIGSSSVSATPIAPALLPATQTVSGTVGTALSATAVLTPNNSFGGSITYSVPSLPSGLSLDPNTGVISGTPTAAQTASAYVITGTSGANTATTSVTIGVSLANQAALTVSAAASSIAVNATTLLSTSGGSGNGAVTYAVASGPCAISNTNTLSGTGGAGLCSITATKAANSTYEAITSSPITVTVTLAPQTTALVASASPTTINVNATSTLSTSGGNGGGTILYEVVSGPCGVVGTTLTGTGAGSCSVTATKAADSTYAAATSSPISVTVQLNPQTALEAIASAINVNVNGTSQLSTTGGSGTGAVTYALASGTACSIAGNILTGTAAGTCSFTATKAADSVYSAATSSAISITVNRNPQTALVAAASPTSINVNGTSTLSTTGGSGTGTVSYAKVSGPCTVSGSTLTGTGAGTCLFTATKAQDADYNEVTSLPASVIVGLAPQSALEVLATPTTFNTGASSQLSTTGGSGTGAVTYEVVKGPCTVSGTTVSSAYAGSCSIVATKAADSAYATALAPPIVVTVGLSPQSALTATVSPSTIQVNGNGLLSSLGGSGTGDVFYTVVSGPCELIGNSLTGTGAGSCIVTATKSADTSYAEVTSTPLTVTVGLAPQSALTALADPTTFSVNDTSTLSTSGGSGTGSVSYALVDGPCSLAGSTVTGKAAGTCHVTATQAADSTYAEITSSPLALTVGLAPQSTLALVSNPSTINVGATSQLGVTGGSGSGRVTYSLVSGPCSLAGNALTGISRGSCVITATKAEDSQYASAAASELTVTVGLAPQTALSGLANPSSLQVYGSATLSSTGGSGTGAVTYTLVSGPCSVSGTTLAGLSEGTCTLTASKAEDVAYAAATSAPFTVVVGLSPQSGLSLLASPSSLTVRGTSELNATGGSGSGAQSYNLLSGPCSLSGATLTGLDAGSCIVTVTQAAADGYAAATSDPVTVTVGLAPQDPLTLNIVPSANTLMARIASALSNTAAISISVNGTAVLSVAGGAGTGAVTFQVTSGPCAISGNTLTGLGQGSCTVIATKAADAIYAAQTSDPILILVGQTAQSSLQVSASPTIIALGGSSTLTASGGDGSGLVTYSLLGGPCSLTGNSLSGIGVGSCSVTATKAASGSYAAVTSTPVTVTVGLLAQSTLTLTASPSTIPATGSSELNVSGGNGAGWVTYTLLSGPCAVSGSVLIGIESGSCSVMAAKAADSSYAATTTNPITITVTTAPVPPPPPPNPIPTLGEWAKIVMMLMMIGAVGWQTRRIIRPD